MRKRFVSQFANSEPVSRRELRFAFLCVAVLVLGVVACDLLTRAQTYHTEQAPFWLDVA